MNVQSILIFDHEEAVRDSLFFVLSEEGYQCFSTSSRAEAIELLRQRPVSMVIMDSEFPELTTMLKAFKEEAPFIKIILISSYADAEVTQQALTRGADDFVLKPLDFDELLDRIKKLLFTAVE